MKKNNKQQFKRIILFGISTTILLIMSGMFWMIWNVYYCHEILEPFYRRGNWLVVAVYTLLMLMFNRVYGGYKIGHLKIHEVIYSQILALLFVNGITYLQISLLARRFVEAPPLLMLAVMQSAVAALWALVAERLYFKLYPPHQMLIIYGSDLAESLIYKMGIRRDKYQICASVSIDEGLDAIKQKVVQYEAVIICDVKTEMRNKILKYCFSKNIRTYITPKISDIIVSRASRLHLFDTPLMLCKNFGLSFEQQIFKRTMDLCISIPAAIILSPLMALTAICIKMYDHGPVLYKQQRLTIGGQEFSLYKFRSMVVDAEKDGVARLCNRNDDRITPIGKIIRAIRFDELPQLFNIIKGDMSLVGPRPERPEIARQYEQDIPEFKFRLKVKAGLTGYAQVMGKYNTTPYDKLKLDLMYIESYSILMDIKLLFMTFKILFLPSSTEGIAEGTITANDVPVMEHQPIEQLTREKVKL